MAQHLKRICPTLVVSDITASVAYYADKLGFAAVYAEGDEFAIVSRDHCQIFLKRGKPSPNRERVDGDFYDCFLHVTDKSSVDAIHADLVARGAANIGPPTQYGPIYETSAHDLDGYGLCFGCEVDGAAV